MKLEGVAVIVTVSPMLGEVLLTDTDIEPPLASPPPAGLMNPTPGMVYRLYMITLPLSIVIPVITLPSGTTK